MVDFSASWSWYSSNPNSGVVGASWVLLVGFSVIFLILLTVFFFIAVGGTICGGWILFMLGWLFVVFVSHNMEKGTKNRERERDVM